jgi:hypothetical protein
VNTDRLIESLARDVQPVNRLGPVWQRATLWLLATSLYAGVLAALLTSRGDFAFNLASRGFVAQQAAALAMALGAVVAACASVVPGYPRWILALPAVGASAWLAALLSAVPREWHIARLAGLADTHELLCIPTIAIAAVPPAIALMLMLRRGAPLNPGISTALAVLAATGLTNVVTCLASPHQSAIGVLAWHGTTLLTVCLFAAAVGRSVLPWRAVDP